VSKGELAIRMTSRHDFSTATLEPLSHGPSASSGVQAFAVVFHRDKEPFCGLDRIGPVVYFSQAASMARAEVIRVYVTPERFEDIRVQR
jgi:hypothetical protein